MRMIDKVRFVLREVGTIETGLLESERLFLKALQNFIDGSDKELEVIVEDIVSHMEGLQSDG